MEVLLLQDVKDVGFAGEVKRVKEGFARNFLFPKKLAKEATNSDVASFRTMIKKNEKEVVEAGTRAAVMAEQIRNAVLTIKHKANDQGKLFGAIGPDEVVDALAGKGVSVTKKQVEMPKAIRTTGEHTVVIRLTAKLKPELRVKIVALS